MKTEESIIINSINTPKKAALAIKRIRKIKNLTQADLAKIANMRQPTISDVEKGAGTLQSFFKIIQALNIEVVVSMNKPKVVIKNTKKQNKVESVLNMLMDDQA